VLLQQRASWYQAPDKILDAIVASLTGGLLVLLVLKLLIKDKHRAGVVASLLVVWFFSWGSAASSVTRLMKLAHVTINADIFLALPYFVLLVALLSLVFLAPRVSPEATGALNLTSLALVIYNVCCIASFEIAFNRAYAPIRAYFISEDKNYVLTPNADAPDIYYVVLDGCARHDTLYSIYGYDNTSFDRTLESIGCYVARSGVTNYPNTVFSLGSSLNMEYLSVIDKYLTPGQAQLYAYRIMGRLLEDNRVVRMLKKVGYRFINFPSGDGGGSTEYMRTADLNIFDGFGSWFNLTLLQSTFLSAIEPQVHLLRTIALQKRLCFFEHAKEAEKLASPKFVLAHVLLPHPPFIFDENAQARELFRIDETWLRRPYKEQVKYVEKRVVPLLYQLISQTKRRLVIVLQGDHGPACTFIRFEDPGVGGLQERMRIFNAYYFPEAWRNKLYPTITPVNTFRLIFNCAFNAQLPLLDDRAYYSTYDFPLPFTDVTKVVK
jgi:hypothetical protein